MSTVHRFTDPAATPADLRPCVVTLGNFDGVHRGHRAVLTQLVETGHELGLPAVIGAADAMARIPDGAKVEVDPTAGRVTVL